ncbi:MAG: adenosylmethionine decarboxylase [Betaproteobacteria bacterium]|nr:adenosylmethionine decarboxylase [Betaproteobacteria bacterium]
MKGLHIIGDLYNCAPGDYLTSAKKLRLLCIKACETAGLSVLGEHFYQFDGFDETQVGGATGAVVLAESHLAIHTWPERQQATLDVYVCNVTADNSKKAEKLYQTLIDALKPADVLSDQIWRGRDLPVPTPITLASKAA